MSSSNRHANEALELNEVSTVASLHASNMSQVDAPRVDRASSDSSIPSTASDEIAEDGEEANALLAQREDEQRYLNEQADQVQNFTWRSVVVGLLIGVIICFSNTYFGLQTGWVSGMAMPAALIGFGFFKTVARCIKLPFTPVENVLVQTVAGAVGTMPLGCGFVGVVPALNFLLKEDENGPVTPRMGQLIVWAIGICLFGVVLGVPLRKEVIIREKLKFPSGTATALMIGVVHGSSEKDGQQRTESGLEIFRRRSRDVRSSTSIEGRTPDLGNDEVGRNGRDGVEADETNHRDDWKSEIRLLIYAFGVSALYTLLTYFIPQLRSLPIFGISIAQNWLWSLNPSPAYIGQGIIMGPATTLHMLLGAVVGWGILSPLAKKNEWAPGPVSDWTTGSKGWIVWVSLAIMLADSVMSLGWLILRPIIEHGPSLYRNMAQQARREGARSVFSLSSLKQTKYRLLNTPDDNNDPNDVTEMPEPDAPPHHLVSARLVLVLFVVSILMCIFAIRFVFPSVPFGAILLSIVLALLLSLVGVRALGETDLNPVSGISKLSQLVFAAVIPSSNPNAIIINLIAGAVSESGALQAGDMLQDLKTGHLLGASPKAQFYGQMIGSVGGAVVSAIVYRLYTKVYTIPGGLFEVPTAYVWIFTARLVTGSGLPTKAPEWALGAGLVFVVLTALRLRGHGQPWQPFVPGGIAVAVGMYNVPSFTLARTFGGLLNWYWRVYRGRDETPVIVLASGLILGEGLVSIVNLALASADVPHL